MVIPPVFAPKVLFMMLQIRPVGVVHFHPEYLVHFTPVRVVHIAPESLAHYSPVEVVHYTPVCSIARNFDKFTKKKYLERQAQSSLQTLSFQTVPFEK